MRILVTGATGLVGRHVVQAGRAVGHDMLPASRRPGTQVAGRPTVLWPGGDLPAADAVVHLAGASIGGRRWSTAYKNEIRRSRIETTQALAASLPKDTALLCASAVGYYGRDPDGPCPEPRGPGDDFLAQVCSQWEKAAAQHKGRVVRLRFGHVLAAGDGILGRLEPLHRLRVAGIIGSGDQSLPWIHAADLGRLVIAAAEGNIVGAVNAVAGNTPYRRLHEALCQRIGGLPRLRVPDVALRLRLGEFAKYLTGGQVVVPTRFDEVSFAPRFGDLDAALDDLYP